MWWIATPIVVATIVTADLLWRKSRNRRLHQQERIDAKLEDVEFPDRSGWDQQ